MDLGLSAAAPAGFAALSPAGHGAMGSGRDAGPTRDVEVSSYFATHGLPVPSAVHDLAVTSANATALAGDSETFSAAGAGGASVYEWLWGDGTNSTSSSDTMAHTYANPGIYLVYVAANVSGTWHDNLYSLLRFVVQNSYSLDTSGNLAQVDGNVVANTSTNASAQSVILPGGFVEVSGWITESPTNPNWQVLQPSFVLLAPEGTANFSAPILSDSKLNAVTVSFEANASYGAYPLSFSVPIQQTYPVYGAEVWSNFTFTVFVGPASVYGSSIPTSPHPGVLYVYQNNSAIPSTLNGIGDGQTTLDPPVSSNYVSLSILQNVYQTLVSLNGTDTGTAASDFVPNLATCVPGSALCEDLYGSPLEWTTTNGTVYNFVVNPDATFYNVSTGAHAPVWPNDVAFSLVRSCMWANVPGSGPAIGNSGEGSFCQDLLGRNGNASWDGGLHSPINNTPSRLLAAITVNNSAYCSSEMMDGVHGAGCVTLSTNFSVDPFGYYQPDFLNFLAYPSESIVSCNWVAAVGLGLPGWTDGSRCTGSPPDPAPSETAWDSYISAVPWANESSPGGPLQFNAVGSGPYALSWISHNAVYIGDDNGVTPLNYTLVANPYWGGTTCQGGLRDGCLPAATDGGTPSYIPRVEVNVTANSTAGEAALSSGTADLVQLASSEAGFGLNGLSDGKFGILQTPTQVISFYMMDLNYSPTQAAKFMGGATPTLPSWAMQDFAFRNFLVAAYPHATTQSEACSPDGSEFCFQYGGLIPSFSADDTPTNLTWPVTNPNTNVSVRDSAAWWWNVTSSDSLVGSACSSSSPCTFPVAVPANDTEVLLEANAFVSEVVQISNGAIQPILAPINEGDYDGATLFYYNNGTQCDGEGGQCIGPFPFPLAWQFETSVLDQPADFFHQMAYTNGGAGMYGSVDALPEALENYSSPCPGPESNPTVTQSCQYTALNESSFLGSSATDCVDFPLTEDYCPASPTLLWNMADHVFTNLSLYVPADQESSLVAFAPWIDPSTLDLNPLLAASGVVDQPFYNIQYLGTIPPGYPLTGGGVSSEFGATLHPSSGLRAETGEIVDRPLQLLIASTGGSGIYHYSWVGLPPGCVSVNAPVLQCTPNGLGNYSIHAVITDSEGHSAVSATVTLVLINPLTASTPVPSVSSGGVDVGQTVTFTTTASGGGGGPDAYSWTTPSGLGCGPSASASITCTPTAAGTYTVSAQVSDPLGDVSPIVTSGGFMVDPLPTISVPLPSAASGTIDVGEVVTFSAAASGGSGGPYSYSWLAPGGLGCAASTSSSIVCTPSAAGSYVIEATSVDSNGGHSALVSSQNFTVDTLPGPPVSKTSVGFLGLPGDDGYYLIAVAGALALALGAGAFYSRAGRGKGERGAQPHPDGRYSAVVSPAEEGQVVTLREGQTDPAEDLF